MYTWYVHVRFFEARLARKGLDMALCGPCANMSCIWALATAFDRWLVWIFNELLQQDFFRIHGGIPTGTINSHQFSINGYFGGSVPFHACNWYDDLPFLDDSDVSVTWLGRTTACFFCNPIGVPLSLEPLVSVRSGHASYSLPCLPLRINQREHMKKTMARK